MSQMFDISGKVAIVTGASRGIGQAIAEAFAQAGVKVVLASRKQDALNTVMDNIKAKGGEALAVAAHNGDKAQLQALVKRAAEAYGRVDILVNNAATNPHFGTLLEAEDSMWQKTIEVNLMGNVWLSQAVVPIMKANGGGKIINIASINGLRPGPYQGIYSITKAAIISLTKTLAMELGGDNIRVNAVAPGLIKTHFAKAIWEDEEAHRRTLESTPVGRIGVPEDISGLALYLASPASDFANGEVFVIDGGLTLASF